jgi:drug/metabolite transporter (DMT)-like permease
MRNLLSEWSAPLVWGMFFATTVYGHVALKLAAGDGGTYDFRRALQACTSILGGTALLAWAISSFLWVVVLTKTSVLSANAISSLRYVFLSLATWVFLHENVRSQHGFGMLLVATGIWLLCR